MPVLKENFSKANELKVIVHNKDDFHFAEDQACQLPATGNLQPETLLFMQPEWSKRNEMMPLIVDYVQQHPKWIISLQTHKYIGIP